MLEALIAAARAAGALLRADFHRPYGHDATHEAELAAERLIRGRLAAVRSDWGFRGEETGARPPTGGETTWWLVDPLDGTRDHEAGIRSGAVSIAAVRDRLPVLGVVYAYAAPDDDGDLFAWAQGYGPPRRNGRPVEHAPPAHLGPEDVVLVSTAADRRAEANAAAVAPARFRAVPGLAYRLARVAAGDGSAGVSLNGPCSWDFAAGHALLRAVGGDLVDEGGRPVRYDAAGIARVRHCVGGHPEAAAALAARDWRAVLAAPATLEPGSVEAAALVSLERSRPSRGDSVRDASLLSRAQGCLLGQIAGDNLGGLVEFSSAGSIAARYPDGVRRLADGGVWDILAGQPTDDSELALALARSVVAAGGYAPDAAAAAYGRWYRSHPFDVGSTTRQALRAISDETPASDARAAANPASQANGSLMRVSPLGVFGHALPPDVLAEMARADSRLTHPHRNCRDACAAFVMAVAHAVRTGQGARAAYQHARSWAEAHAAAEVAEWLREAEARGPADVEHQQGYVRHAFQNAFHQMLTAPTLEEGVVRTVMLGGDTDTNAAIAGALLGAVHGREAVPRQWRRMVLSCHPLQGQPRPGEYRPVDAMTLAERLLALGMTHETQADPEHALDPPARA